MHTCMHECTRRHTHTHRKNTSACTHARTHTCTHTHTHTHTQTKNTHTHTQKTCVHTHTNKTRAHAHAHTHTHTHTRTKHTHRCTHTKHTHTHTHTQILAPCPFCCMAGKVQPAHLADPQRPRGVRRHGASSGTGNCGEPPALSDGWLLRALHLRPHGPLAHTLWLQRHLLHLQRAVRAHLGELPPR